MSSFEIFHIDAFTDKVFQGNPAAVIPLENWLSDELLQQIASENNLSETAFFRAIDTCEYEIRWFTPFTEVSLCGHATLAAADVIFRELSPGCEEIVFHSMSGPIKVWKEATSITMDFPATPAMPCEMPEWLVEALGDVPEAVYKSRDYLVVLHDQAEVERIIPNTGLLESLDGLGTIVTAPGHQVDFVSRCFYPHVGVMEDSVTGSAHCTLAPYWSRRLGKTQLNARQLSPRGGELACEFKGERVWLTGQAVPYMAGTIRI